MDGYFETHSKLLTRRGVMWLGQTCNLRCHFCYFLDRIEDVQHPEHSFMSLDKAKSICRDMRERYGNSSVDIQGGEPSIYKHIDALVAYCAEIGLQPSLITNGVALAKREKCESLKAAGIRDLLISVQGIGDVYDEIVCRPGSWTKQLQGIRNCIDVGIPIRFNCVLTAKALPQMLEIARLAIDAGALAVNFLAFNPFEDQRQGHRSTDNVARYTDVKTALEPALDLLAEAGIEVNIRYMPFCMVPERHRASVYNLQQLSYDAHEWDFDSWSWTNLQPQRMKEGPTSAHHDSMAAFTYNDPDFEAPKRGAAAVKSAAKAVLRRFPGLLDRARRVYWRARVQSRSRHAASSRFLVQDELGRQAQIYRDSAVVRAEAACGYEATPACGTCDVRRICDGFHQDYSSMFGSDEAQPIQLGGVLDDPLHFAWDQLKIYEPEERTRPFTDMRPWEPPSPQPSSDSLRAYETAPTIRRVAVAIRTRAD